jgi:hypothetical protein
MKQCKLLYPSYATCILVVQNPDTCTSCDYQSSLDCVQEDKYILQMQLIFTQGWDVNQSQILNRRPGHVEG